MGKNWTAHDIPEQTGRIALVTGANSGIGLETARELSRKGARVLLACRSEERAAEAIADIRSEVPEASVEFGRLDLADLDQVREFSTWFRDQFDRLDLLINNAGVMIPPEGKTKQGSELQFGVNHIGHFALTGLLLDRMLTNPGTRIVNVSSTAHRFGSIDFDDLDFTSRGYSATGAYGQSKLANLLFTAELARRIEEAGRGPTVAAAHPGWTQTNLQQHSSLIQLINPLFGMQPPGGALPTLRAATDPGVKANEYYGPGRFFEMSGPPVRVGRTKAAESADDARRLWEVSEERTGVRYPLARAATAG